LEENYTIAEVQQTFSVKKEYDKAGNKTKIIYPSGRVIVRKYDPLSRLLRVEDQTNQLRQLAEYRYKGLNLDEILFGTTQVPVVETRFEYDPEKKLLSQKTYNPNVLINDIPAITMGREMVWNQRHLRETIFKTERNYISNRYGYDKMKRIIEEQINDRNPEGPPPAEGIIKYDIDNVYNIKNVLKYSDGMKEEKIYQTNKKNQVIQVGNISISWDGNGNMTSKSNGYNFKYDFQNRLREATNPGGLNITFVYDNFNRRIMKKYANSQQPSIIYIWEEDEPIEEYNFINGNFKLSKQFIPGHSIDQKISATVDLDGDGQLETEYYFLQDQLGNVESIIGGDGKKLEEYEYQGYGNFKVYQPDRQKPIIEQARINENGKLAILFNEAIMAESINNQNIQLLDSNSKPIAIEFQLDEEKRQIIIAPALTNGSNYTLSIQNIYDLNSNKIDNYTKYFTAQANTVIDDTKSPEIEIVYQEAGSLIVKFTEDLKPETVNQNSIILKRNGNAVAGTTEMVNSRTLKFIAAQSLIVNLDYELTIDPSLKDLADKPVSQQLINFIYLDLPISFYSKQNQRTEISTTAYSNFHLFQGRDFDKELDLYYFRNRYLDPELKIWTTKDPEEYADSYNLYQSFLNNFINNNDPFGNRLIINLFWDSIRYDLKYKLASKLRVAFLNAGIKLVNINFPLGNELGPRVPENLAMIDIPNNYSLMPSTAIKIARDIRKKMAKYRFNLIADLGVTDKPLQDEKGQEALGITYTKAAAKSIYNSPGPSLVSTYKADFGDESLIKYLTNISAHEVAHQFNIYPYDGDNCNYGGQTGIMRTCRGKIENGTYILDRDAYAKEFENFSDIDAFHLKMVANNGRENLQWLMSNIGTIRKLDISKDVLKEFITDYSYEIGICEKILDKIF